MTITNRKNRYQQQLRTYLQRREALKRKYPCKNYDARLKRIQDRIDGLRRNIRTYSLIDAKMNRLAKSVHDYTGVPVKLIHGGGSGEVRQKTDLAVSLFIKLAMETGVTGFYLTQFLGYKDSHGPSRNRRRFTRSFATNEKNYNAWKKFREYLFIQNNIIT